MRTDKKSKREDKVSLGTDKLSLGTDKWSMGEDKYSNGEGVRFENFTAKLESMSGAKKESYLKKLAYDRERDRDPKRIAQKELQRQKRKKMRQQEEGI